jgi:FAD synthase
VSTQALDDVGLDISLLESDITQGLQGKGKATLIDNELMKKRILYLAQSINERSSLSDSSLLDLDFDEDLYGKTIEIIFRQKLREELKFDGLEALKQQMSVDVQQVREVFNERLS